MRYMMIVKIGNYFQSDRNYHPYEIYNNNIEIIVNLSVKSKDRSASFMPSVEYYKIPIKNCTKIPKRIMKAIYYLTKGKRSLIHCREGRSRSIAVIYYLQKMIGNQIPIEEIKKIRPNAIFCILKASRNENY